MSAAAWAAVADAVGVGPGLRVLDVGCGDGGFCALAAERGAQACGVDADAAAVERARRRVPAADLRVGLMEDLPWPDGRFDAVVGFNAFQYALDIELALREAVRVLRPDGRVGVCKWDPEAENELFALAAAVGAGSRAALRARDPVEVALRRVGLRVHARGTVPVELEVADLDALAAATGVARGALSGPGERFRRPDGSYRFAAGLKYMLART
jgi:ubiquinone/menaquinone biosynthesis C-methylase UbiE